MILAFFLVTFGACGTTCQVSIETVARAKSGTGVEVALHGLMSPPPKLPIERLVGAATAPLALGASSSVTSFPFSFPFVPSL